MFLRINNLNARLFLTVMCCATCTTVQAANPEDDIVAEYLQSNSLNTLLEAHLFDRVTQERDPEARLAHSNELGQIYLDVLNDQEINNRVRKSYLLKAQILVEMIPMTELLELRLELLVEQYKEFEHVADLKRIELLNEELASEAIVVLDRLYPTFSRIASVAESDVERFNRQAARSSGESQRQNEQLLADARAVYSRSRFFEGWSGYSLAVLSEREVESSVFKAFGWVLGFDGKLPILEDADLDLLEYDHVSRSMLGVALCNLQNSELGSARLWLDAVQSSPIAPEFAAEFAARRIVDVSLEELDWKRAMGEVRALAKSSSDSQLDVSLSRLLVIKSLSGLQDKENGRGGEATATELAKIGLNRLIELGEIGHVIDLLDRYGSLPDIGGGFVGYFAQAVSELNSAENDELISGYSSAALRFDRALKSKDVGEYPIYAADAALKLAYCELRSGRANAALESLDLYREYIKTTEQLNESAWLELLALDAVVRSGQDQMGPRLADRLGTYIRQYPDSDRASKLIVQYALSPYLDDLDAISGLVIEDLTDPLALPARRKLVQMLYKQPQLSNGGRDQAAVDVLGHAQWIWKNEEVTYTSIREARERLAVCRIAVMMGFELTRSGTIEERRRLSIIETALIRMRELVEEESAFDEYRSELAFREIQLMLAQGQIDPAASIATHSQELNEGHRISAMYMVFGNAHKRFMEVRSVPHAQSVVLYGQELLGISTIDASSSLDSRLSLHAESVMMGALYLSEETDDMLMRELALALGLRVLEHGIPSEFGMIQTAILCEEFGKSEDALNCWNRLVHTLDDQEGNWHRARYESLRLLQLSDPLSAHAVYRQYLALYPNGSPEPWGTRIASLFQDQQGGAP